MTTIARRDRRQTDLSQRREARRTRSGRSQPRRGPSLMIWLTGGAIVAGLVVVGAIAFLRQDMPITEGLNAPTAASAYTLATGNALGQDSAPVTVEVWSDYQCPYCQRFATTWESSLTAQFVAGGQVQIIYRDYAFIGEESIQAAIAARCAGNQGQYWQFHDYLFANQNGENKGWFSNGRLQGIAQELGLDLNAFNTCRADPAMRQAVVNETTQGHARGVTSTPTISINGKLNTNIQTYADLSAAVQAALPKP